MQLLGLTFSFYVLKLSAGNGFYKLDHYEVLSVVIATVKVIKDAISNSEMLKPLSTT